MRKRFKILFLTGAAVVLLLFTAETSYAALEMEYYTYGSFDAILSAFQKAALVFSDKNYMALMFVVITLGIFFAASGSMISALKGMKTGGFSWAVPVGIGVVLFLAMIIPKGTIHIYDPVKNRYQSVGDVPEGLILLAGTTNLIERGLVDVISTAADPIGYQQQAGGIGFDMLNNVHSKGIILSDQYIHNSLKSYTEDCVFFELLRTGTQLSANTINKNSDFMSLYAQAQNPAIFTVYYKDEDSWREGQTKTCTQAYTLLSADINNTAKYTNATKARCGEIGFDPTIPAEFQQCKDMFSNLASWFEGAAWEQVNFFKQVVIAQTFGDAVIAASPDTALAIMMSRNAGTSMMASGAMANSWIPTIRGILVSVAIMLTPFLVIFLPTPLYGKALGLICGLFVWPMSWGIIDAALHGFAMDFSYKAMEEVRQNELGLLAVSSFGTSSLKALAMFGAVRWSGLMLSTVITGMMIKFGGHALAMMAGGITGPVQGAAAKAGMETQTPEGRAGIIQGMPSAASAHMWANKFSGETRAEAMAAEKLGHTQGMTGLIKAKGLEGTADMVAEGTAGKVISYGGAGRAMLKDGVDNAYNKKEFEASTNLGATGQRMSLYGTPDKASIYKTAVERSLVERQGIMQGFLGKQGIDVSDPKDLDLWERTGKHLPDGKFLKDAVFDNKGQFSYGVIGGTKGGNAFEQTVDSQGKVLKENAQGTFSFGGQTYAGAYTREGNAVRFTGQGTDRKTVSMEGTASGLNPQTGEVEGWKLSHSREDQGANTKMVLSPEKAQELSQMGGIKGTEYGKHLSKLAAQGKSVEAVYSKDVDSGGLGYVGIRAGGETNYTDYSLAKTGWRKSHEALKTTDTGERATTGVSIKNLNERSNSGAFNIADPDTGKPITVQGQWFYDDKGNAISAQYTNLKTGEVFTAQKVMDKGQETVQYGVSKSQIGPDGKRVYSFKSISDREVATGKYVAKQTIGTDGRIIHSDEKGGKNTAWYDQFIQHEKIASEQSLLRAVATYGSDYTNLQPWQENLIRAGGATQRAVDAGLQGARLKKASEVPDQKLDMSNKSWKHLEPKKPSVRATPDWMEKYGAK